MTDIQINEQGYVKQSNLYATLSIFVNKAPKLIDLIEDAVNKSNMEEVENHATKLIIHSSNAQLDGFTQRVKDLIIAARENNLSILKEHSSSLKSGYKQMTKSVECPV
jgi:hypothetical protein